MIRLAVFCLIAGCCAAQSTPRALRDDISIRRLMTVRKGAMRLAYDGVSRALHYSDYSGNIYRIAGDSLHPHDSLVITAKQQQIDFPQCFIFHDSDLYVLGNNTPDAEFTTGVVTRGTLKPDGTRQWSYVMQTEPFPTCGYFDHKFSGMVLDPAGDSIIVNSGSRGDHGEIESAGGKHPGLRNVPLTSRMFKIPARGYTYLRNDSAWLAASGFAFVQGTRNSYAMAFDAHGNLFGLENSGDRDHNDEMNWLRRGKHYGFPYCMGDTWNPQQYAGYDKNTDKLLSHCSAAWRQGIYGPDPTFPKRPAGVVFEKPVQNHGPDADMFRDTVTGGVLDASDLGLKIGTFTAHRSPLGLLFDNDSLLAGDLRGEAFMLSWTKGTDSTGGIMLPGDTNIGPFVDPSQDLIRLHLVYDQKTDAYEVWSYKLVDGFANPVGQVQRGNRLYVLEWGYTGTSGLYEVTLPAYVPPPAKSAPPSRPAFVAYPNPAVNSLSFLWPSPYTGHVKVRVYNNLGHVAHSTDADLDKVSQLDIPLDALPDDIYYYTLDASGQAHHGKLVVVR